MIQGIYNIEIINTVNYYMENNIIDIYDIFYNGYIINKKTENEDNILTLLNDIIFNLKNKVIAKYNKNLNFHSEYLTYNPIFNKNESKFNDFDINKLPLINVARYLNIRVEKTKQISYNGLFNPFKNSIMLGDDNKETFLHELAHAVDHIFKTVDHIIESNDDDKIYAEITAEMVAITLANIFNVSIDLEYSKYYMERYTGKDNLFFVINQSKERILQICKYIVECQKKII